MQLAGTGIKIVIPIAYLKLSPESFRSYTVDETRKEFVRAFAAEPLVNAHKQSGGFLYRVPLVQFKSIYERLVIVGVGAGAEFLSELADKDMPEPLGDMLNRSELELREHTFQIGEQKKTYRFIIPWAALNSDNYKIYKESDKEAKRELLEKTLTGNILSFFKSIGFNADSRIETEIIESATTRRVTVKGVTHNTFELNFATNADLPDFIGLGRFTSRGFGTIFKKLPGKERES